MDLVQHLTGLEDNGPVRRPPDRPQDSQEAEEGDSKRSLARRSRPEDYEEVPIETEDFGAVLVHLGDRARGAYTVSQVNAGCKNRFQMEIFGTKCGVIWNQERPDELWIGHRNSPNQILLKDPSLLLSGGREIRRSPGRT